MAVINHEDPLAEASRTSGLTIIGDIGCFLPASWSTFCPGSPGYYTASVLSLREASDPVHRTAMEHNSGVLRSTPV
ncbi:hypothetical protein HYFRA_00002563 [Hymenoscyphus fraxineus]|uniref:Uncharacterized protein n=1 Tax=Hymenoscyphus fraxineus TaxID=746836 RepID=A0A9N9LAI1_9HELO|nr:hypothetical protein HYFRA_00002563 [Hymenoscyphus fraxineus]